jgi:WD40 repeat protein
LWCTAAGDEALVLSAPGPGALAFSPDGASLAALAFEGVVVWDLKNVYVSAAVPGNPGVAVAFAESGAHIVSAALDEVASWNRHDNEQTARLSLEGLEIWPVAVSSDGRYVAAREADDRLSVWDWNQGERVLEVDSSAAVAFSGDARRFAWSEQGLIHVATVAPSVVVQVPLRDSDSEWPTLLVLGMDGGLLVYCTEDDELVAANVETGRRLWRRSGAGGPTALALSPDGARLAVARDDSVRIWHATRGEELLVLPALFDRSSQMAFSPDGARLAVAHRDGPIVIWDAGGQFASSRPAPTQP